MKCVIYPFDELLHDFRADLHCHSTCSDGTESPLQILELAKQKNLKGLSITDHDSVEAYVDLFPAAKKLEIEIVPGVEFSAVHDNSSVHILAYAFDLKSEELHNFCMQHKQRREQRNQLMLDQLTANGMPLTIDEVLKYSETELPLARRTIGRPHIALAMVQKGYVDSVQEAFKLHLGENRECYVRGTTFTVTETIDLIHKAKGLAFIAHPHLIKKAKLTPKLLAMNFDGIECYYARLANSQNEHWVKIAKQKNWLITGGSDFHGSIKPNLDLGNSWTSESTFNILKDHYKTHSNY